MGLIFEQMNLSHQREVTMSALDNFRFLTHLNERARDLDNPLPFSVGSYFVDREELSESELQQEAGILGNLAREQIKLSDKSKINLHCPAWRCFVKVTSNTRVILTILPASYNDVLKLNDMENSVRSKASSICEEFVPKIERQVNLEDVKMRVSVVDRPDVIKKDSQVTSQTDQEDMKELDTSLTEQDWDQSGDHTDTGKKVVNIIRCAYAP